MKSPSAKRNIVGRRVSALRYRRGWSQSFLAAQCQLQGWDIDRFTIARIERGTRWVGDFELLRLAGALRVSAAELLGASSTSMRTSMFCRQRVPIPDADEQAIRERCADLARCRAWDLLEGRTCGGEEACGRCHCHEVQITSTVSEIEAAIERLSAQEQREFADWLNSRMHEETPAMLKAPDEGVRSLEAEPVLPVEDVRRKIKEWSTASS